MTFAERMQRLASKIGDVTQDFASKAGETVQDIGEKSVSASKELLNTAQELGTKGLQASKELVNKASDMAQDIGEKGKLALEIKKLEFKTQKLTAQLGAEVYAALVERKLDSVNISTPAIKDILYELDALQKEIDKNEAELEKS
jgi:ElaB/YqjD/DUF883 family membrane-anchored ribosome-binding protein